jgi:hypothetical protein
MENDIKMDFGGVLNGKSRFFIKFWAFFPENHRNYIKKM